MRRGVICFRRKDHFKATMSVIQKLRDQCNLNNLILQKWWQIVWILLKIVVILNRVCLSYSKLKNHKTAFPKFKKSSRLEIKWIQLFTLKKTWTYCQIRKLVYKKVWLTRTCKLQLQCRLTRNQNQIKLSAPTSFVISHRMPNRSNRV